MAQADGSTAAPPDLAPPIPQCVNGWISEPLPYYGLDFRGIVADAQHGIHFVTVDETGALITVLDEPGAVPSTIAAAGDSGLRFPHAAIGSDGSMHVVGERINHDIIDFATRDWRNGTWQMSTLGPGRDPRVAVDGNGAAHIVYSHVDGSAVAYATDASGTWVTTMPAGLPSSSIAVDGGGSVHVLGGSAYATNASGSWATETLTGVKSDALLLVESNGTPHVISGGIHAWKSAAGWQRETIATKPNPWTVAATFDSHSAIHVVWLDAYATNRSGTWVKIPLTFSNTNDAPGPLSMVVLTDAQDGPHIFPVDFFTGGTHQQPGPIQLFEVQPCP